ncbi:TonB-dependent receptor, partial [Paraglaciecola sp.]|uniref:TonB-dependent receptor n=1 Tax=Paraglaciecola sp. TaxID=1920173 RepID=UPI003EF408D4
MKHKFKISAVSAAVIASFVTIPAYAVEQEQESPNEVDQETEVIEITGFKGSLQKALNSKRFSENVSDSIHAEDVGKSTDQNIADALSRVTGVTVQSEGGEGTRISVRGTGPSMNQIQMNGVSLTGGLSGDQGSNPTANQSVDLSSFSSDILSSIDVIKTSAADQDEGSLGATVVLRTVKPLSLNSPRRMLSVEARNNEYAGSNDSRITGSFADKYLDDTLGFIVTVAKDTNSTRQDRLQTDWTDAAIPIADLNATSGRTAHDLASGKYIRILEAGQTTADLVNWDPDTQIAHNGPLDVMARNYTQISTTDNQRDRFSISAGLEWTPLDTTNIQLDVTHTKQEVTTDYHNFRLNFAALTGVSGSDPVSDWNGVNLETRTLNKHYNRKSGGSFNRTQGLRELETNVVSLEINHEITDDLSMDIMLGYSGTVDETKGHVGLSTATWGTIGNTIIEAVPLAQLEPLGHDCRSNGECSFTMGITPANIDPFDGSVNSVTSSFNPFDLEANHLGGLRFRENSQEDTNQSAHLNFDWVIDEYYITTVEFGAKYAKRVKDVYTQNTNVNTGTALIDNSNPDTSYATVGMGSINLIDMLSGESFPYDNFGEDITADRSNAAFGGWPMLDANKAIAEFAGRDPGTVGTAVNNLGTREIETETNAAYLKVSFEGFDGRLTGNLGLRYIKDTNNATGYGGITFHRPPHMLDPYDLLVERGLGTIEGQEACPEAVMGINPGTGGTDTRWEPLNSDQLTGCFDWAISHGYNYWNDDTTPYVDGEWVLPGGVDTNRLVFGNANDGFTLIDLPNQVLDINGNLVATSALTHRQFASAGEIWPYLDRSTSFVGPNGDQQNTTVRQAPTSGTASHSLLLPSLNLNYAINEESIARFAVSQTMTRPEFDSLNPRLTMNENVWGPTAEGRAGNVNLKPLKSNNLDLSYEWYFNESGMLSTALFYKQMTDFPETVVTPFHYIDVRSDYDLENANLLLDFDASRQPGDVVDDAGNVCMPHRYYAGFGASSWDIECHTALIEVERNGQEAKIAGLEIGYTQNYDFLPGIWSGLGLSFNYTYQRSEKDPEEIGTTGLFTQPLPQEFTPEHSANTTVFYEKDGTTLRFAHRYSGVQLINDGITGGAIWQESSSLLDFSSSYRINNMFTVTFQITNLTDEVYRNFYTAYDIQNSAGEVVYD